MGQHATGGAAGAVVALVVAVAPAHRIGAGETLWREVAGRPLIAWALAPLANLAGLRACIVVVDDAATDRAQTLEWSPGRRVAVQPVAAGANLASALRAGLPAALAAGEWVIALDAWAPLVSSASLRAGLLAAAQTGAAIAGEAVKETLKLVEGQRVAGTPPRASLRRLQPPVIARGDLWRGALADVAAPSPDDDLIALALRFSVPLTVYAIDYPGARVASEADLALVEALLRERAPEAH
ncbi:MAG: 2-C-methyl-D-erythritol 4-phosphate cytidylyltransferase [Chloroflexota bacterium]|nr:2-C-methyl-D-erythritol 4-phosphate cytidylyltransferase [Chloroflexota bacterium]